MQHMLVAVNVVIQRHRRKAACSRSVSYMFALQTRCLENLPPANEQVVVLAEARCLAEQGDSSLVSRPCPVSRAVRFARQRARGVFRSW